MFPVHSTIQSGGHTMTIHQDQAFAGDDAPTQAFQVPRQRHAAPQQSPVPPRPQPAWQGAPAWQGQSQQPLSQQKPPKKRRWPWVLGAFVALLVIIAVANSGGSTTASPTAAPTVPAPAPSSGSSSSSAIQQASGNYGAQLSASDLSLTASTPKKVSSVLGTQLCSTVSYKNTGSSSESFNVFDWKFRTAAGVESPATVAYDGSSALSSGDLQPGGTVSGSVCADSTITKASAVVYSPGFGIMHELTWQ